MTSQSHWNVTRGALGWVVEETPPGGMPIVRSGYWPKRREALADLRRRRSRQAGRTNRRRRVKGGA